MNFGISLPGRTASVPAGPTGPRPSGTTSYARPNRTAPAGRPNRHQRAPLGRVMVGIGAALVVAGLAYGLFRSLRTGAQGVFRKVAPSIVVVLGGNAKDAGQGSGVVVSAGRVITNAHVAQHTPLRVVYKDKEIPATASVVDRTRDLAELRVEGLSAPPARLRTEGLSVGDRVYAVGAPRGLDLTLSEGLVSSLRTLEGERAPIIQTSAPISPGSSGGGLFDEEGRLIGITTFQLLDSQNLNFALPVAWIEDLRAGIPIHSPLPYAVKRPDAPKEEKIDVPARVAELLGEPWIEDRDAAIAEMSKIGRRVLTPLTDQLERGDDEARARAAFALGQLAAAAGFGSDNALALSRLRQSLTQEKELSVRIYVAQAIEKFGRDGYQSLAFLQRHDDAMLRVAAAKALGQLADSSSVRSLGFLLQDKEPTVREAARKALVEVGAPAVEVLSGIVKTATAPYFREKTDSAVLAAQALGAIGPAARPALEILQEAARNQDGVLASAASLAIEKIRG